MVSIMQLKMVKIYFITWIEEVYHSLVTEIDYGCQQDPKDVYQPRGGALKGSGYRVCQAEKGENLGIFHKNRVSSFQNIHKNRV